MATRPKIGKRERILLIVLGVIALGAVAFLLLSGGGDSTQPTAQPTGRIIVPRRPTVRPSASPLPNLTPPDTFDSADARDPFRSPLGSGAPGPAPDPGATGSPTPRPSEDFQGGTRVSLLDVFTRDGVRFASVEVGGEQHNVKEGDTFAGNYRVVSITESCATFVMGDERFTLCNGQEVFK